MGHGHDFALGRLGLYDSVFGSGRVCAVIWATYWSIFATVTCCWIRRSANRHFLETQRFEFPRRRVRRGFFESSGVWRSKRVNFKCVEGARECQNLPAKRDSRAYN